MKTVVKSIISACALSLFVVSASFAQDSESTMDAQTEDTYTQDDNYTQDGMQTQQDGQLAQDGQMTQEENKVAVQKEELPAEVSDAIEDSEYADWSIAEAFEVTDQEEVVYEIHFENPEGQKEKESFNKMGESVAR